MYTWFLLLISSIYTYIDMYVFALYSNKSKKF